MQTEQSKGREGMRLYMKKMGIIVLVIILFLISVISGFLVRSFINFSKEENSAEEKVLAEQESDESINTNSVEIITVSPNANVIKTQYYKRCGHSRTVKEIVPREIVNLSEDKVQEYYKDWTIDSFTSNEIKLIRENKGICEEHYILRESDGYISISTKNDIGEYIFKGLTDIPVMYLPEEDIKELEEGIELVGRDSLNKFLENYE